MKMDISHQNGDHSEAEYNDPLGTFHRLPAEVTEHILSYLPASRLVDLASLSKSWHSKIKQQSSTKQSMQSAISSTRVVDVNGNLVYHAAKFKDLARLVRLITVFHGGFGVRLRWLRTIMQQIRVVWTAPRSTLKAFNSFLEVCFGSCTEDEFEQVIKAVNTKLGMLAYVGTIVALGRGKSEMKELRLATVTNLIFGKRFQKEITRFLVRGRSNADIAHIAYTLQLHDIDSASWSLVENNCGPRAHWFRCIAEVLNWPFWAEDPYNIDAILVALVDHDPQQWKLMSIAGLFVHLSQEISMRYLLRAAKGKASIILMHVGKHSLDALEKLKARLRQTSKQTYSELMRRMKLDVKREILKPMFCGSCRGYCAECQHKKLFKMYEFCVYF